MYVALEVILILQGRKVEFSSGQKIGVLISLVLILDFLLFDSLMEVVVVLEFVISVLKLVVVLVLDEPWILIVGLGLVLDETLMMMAGFVF